MNPSIILQTEIQNLWKRINNVTGTLQEFNDREDKTHSSNVELLAKNKELNDKFAEIASTRQKLEGDCQNLAERLKTFDEVKSANAELLRTISDYNAREKDLKQKLQDSEYSNRALEHDLSELRGEAAEMKESLKNVDSLNKENDTLRHDIHAVQMQLADFELAKEAIARKNKELFEQTNTIRIFKDKTADFESKMFEMENLKTKFAAVSETNEKLSKILAEKDAAIDKLNAEKNESDDSKLAKIDKLQKDIVALNEKINTMTDNYKALYDGKQKVLNRQTEMLDEIANYISEGENYRSTIEDLKTKIDELTETDQKNIAEINRLHGKHDDEVCALLNTISTFKKEKIEIEAKLNDVKKGKGLHIPDAKIQTLENENNLLNKQIEDDLAKIEELNKKISENNEIIVNLNSELALHKDRDNSIESGKAEIIAQIESFMKNYKKK